MDIMDAMVLRLMDEWSGTKMSPVDVSIPVHRPLSIQ